MPVHPELTERFALLEGITSMREAYADPDFRARIQAFEDGNAGDAPPDVPTRADAAPGPHGAVPVRVYAGAEGALAPCLVWLHGGGFIGGDLDMREADWTSRAVAAGAGAVVVSVDYRLANDGIHYPVPHDDAVAAVAWVRDNAESLGIDPARIAVGGASAGANLSCGAVLRLRDRDDWVPAALALVYGVFHPIIPAPSLDLTRALSELPPVMRGDRGDTTLTENYLGAPVSEATGYAMPALARLSGLCPTVLINAEYDGLRSSAEAFAGDLARAGVDVRQVQARGLTHGFLNHGSVLPPIAAVHSLLAATVAEAGVVG